MGRWKYGVILDAGSSGTRVHVYRWLNSAAARVGAGKEELNSLPVLTTEKDWTKKIHPGVSTFGEKPELVGPDHLRPVFEHAQKIIPAQDHAETPIFLLATAGMRLLPDHQRNTLLERICSYARETTRFQLPDCDLHIQVIPGETEGLYGWVAANYLLGGFDKPVEHNHGKNHHTYGFLDMGGASAQIAFAPNATEAEKHTNDLKLLRMRKVNGEAEEYQVFVTTWLGFGVNEARRRYIEALQNSTSPDVLELPDPCVPKGLKVTKTGVPIGKGSKVDIGAEPHLIGTGRFTECLSQTYPLLDKDAPCADNPCLLNGVHVPAIDFDVNHFVGVSEYWHTTHEVFEMAHKDKAYDFHTYQLRVNEFCTQPWEDIMKGLKKHKWGKKVDETKAMEVCFKASWLINMLHDGIGVPRQGLEEISGSHNGTKEVLHKAKQKGFVNPFQAVNKIEGVEVSWTLGKMVLYAASQVPPANNALAVGFGSNEPGIPGDFQHAGGQVIPPSPDHLIETETEDWHDALFSDSPRRIPGVVLFLLIVCLAGFLLCGRERRTSMYNKIRGRSGSWPRHSAGSSPRKRNRGLGAALGLPGKIFSSHSQPAYERVLERDAEAGDFELGDVDSDSYHSDSTEASGSGRFGRTSGLATPQLNAKQSAFGLSSPHMIPHSAPHGYADSNNVSVTSNPVNPVLNPPILLPNPMDAGGLMSRTDSRERLAPGVRTPGIHSRSTANSPTRIRSPALGRKGYVD